MGEQARFSTFIRDWPGLVTNLDPVDYKPGMAAEQVNVGSATVGELTVRRGFLVVSFDATGESA